MFSVVSKRALACKATLIDGDKVSCYINFSGRGTTGTLTRTLEKSFLHNPNQKLLDFIAQEFLKYPHAVHSQKVGGYQNFVVANSGPQGGGVNKAVLKDITLEVYEIVFDNENSIATKKSLGLKGSYANY